MTHADDRLLDRALTNHHLIVRSDVALVGLSSGQWVRRLDRHVWVEMAPGVWRHRATPDSWRLRARAALRWLGSEAGLYGRTAAAWWELDGRPVDVIEVLVPRRRKTIDGPFVIHTTKVWTPHELRMHDGLRVTEPARAIIDMAATERSAQQLEHVIDEAIRRRMLTVERLSARVGALGGSGRQGTTMLRSLLLDSGGESHLERRFLRLVRTAGFPRPNCQVVHRRGGQRIARVDFLFPGTDVVVEVTGRLGHASDAERRQDARRRNALQEAGRVVIEFTTADVLDAREYVVSTLDHWLRVRR